MNIKKIIQNLLLTTGLFLVASMGTAFAATGEGTATVNVGTGGTHAGDATYGGAAASGIVTVGTQSYLKIDLTVGAAGITPVENNVTVQINTNLFPTNGWGAGVAAPADVNVVGEWSLVYTDTDSITTDNTAIDLSSSSNNVTGLITIQANQQMDATDIITIYAAVNDTNYARAAANIVIQTRSLTAATALTTIAIPPTIATQAQQPTATAATVTLQTATVGATQNTSITFTIPRDLVSGDTVEFTLPSSLYVGGLDITDSAQTFGGVATFDCTATQFMVCTADGTIGDGSGPSTGVITLTGVTGRYILGAQTLTNFEVESLGTAANDIAVDTSVAVDAVTAEQASGATAATVTLASAVAGVTQTTSVNFTLPVPLISGDTVQFTMPEYLYVGGLNESNSAQSFGGAGTFDCVDTVQAIVCRADGAVNAGTGTISLLGVTGEYVAEATTLADFEVEYQGGSTADVAVDMSVAVPAVTIGAISFATITPADMTSSQYNPHTIAFTTPYIPSEGKIVITYPSGWDVASVNGLTAHTLSGLSGTWIASVSGQVITLTQSAGGTATSAGAKSLKLESIKAPVSAGSGGNATITTKIAAGTNIATLATVSTGTVAAGSNSGSWDSSTTNNATGQSLTTTATTTTTTTTTTDTTSTTTPSTPATTTTTDTDKSVTAPTPEPVVVTTPSGETVTLTDLPETHWSKDVVTAMVEAGIVKGNADGTFKPDSSLNRAEAAALLYRVMGLEEPIAPEITPFSDVAVSEWYAGYVSELKDRKVVNGNPDGTYKPTNDINRAEFLTLAMNLYSYLADDDTKAAVDALKAGEQTKAFKDLDASKWYSGTVTAAAEKGFISGKACGEDKCFNAESNITRAEATQVLYNMFGKMLQVELPVK